MSKVWPQILQAKCNLPGDLIRSVLGIELAYWLSFLISFDYLLVFTLLVIFILSCFIILFFWWLCSSIISFTLFLGTRIISRAFKLSSVLRTLHGRRTLVLKCRGVYWVGLKKPSSPLSLSVKSISLTFSVAWVLVILATPFFKVSSKSFSTSSRLEIERELGAPSSISSDDSS